MIENRAQRIFGIRPDLAVVAGAALFDAPTVKAQRPLPKSEYDYVDWSWEKWRKITKAVRPRVTGEQSGKAELIDLLASGNEKITTLAGVANAAQEIKNRLHVFLGDLPKSKPPLAAKITEETSRDGTHFAETRVSNRAKRICAGRICSFRKI